MPFTRKTTRTYRPETFYRHFHDARALQTCTHDAHARKTHAKRTRNAHETSTVTGGATLRSLPVPNPHCSPPPSSLSPPQPALFADHLHPNPHCSPTISTPPRTLRRPTAPTHGSPFVPNQPRTVRRHHLPYLHPNPHCSPTISTPTRTVRRPSPPQPALFADHLHPNPHCSPTISTPTPHSSPTRY